MSTYDDYRTIDVTIDGVNDYPAQIIVSTGDTDGRRIRAKFMVDGTPVTDATGAAIYYGNDNVAADSVTMTEETDGVYTGVIPTAAYAGKACATVTVGLKKGASIVMSRSIRLIIDHAFGDDAPDNIDAGQLEDAINRAETAADKAEDSATVAKTSETNAKNSANSAAGSASAAQTAKNSASASATAAKASETNAKTSENNAKASATAAKTSETNAKTSETNAKTSETKAASSAKTAQTAAETAQEIADNFGVTASATASEPGGAASVNVTKNGTSYDLAFTIPRGAQGPKGDPGDALNVKFSDTIIGNGTSGNPYKVKPGTLMNCSIAPSDLNTITQIGSYVFPNEDVSNAPYMIQRGLLIYSHNKPINEREFEIAFIFYNGSGDVTEIWMRQKGGAKYPWTAWFKVAPTKPGLTSVAADETTILGNGTSSNKLKLANGTALTPKAVTGSGQDLNNYTNSGIYYIDITACANTPISGQAGRLIVIKGGNHVSQLFHNTQQNRFFTRAKTTGWSPWVELTPSGAETWPKFSELRSNLQLVALSETRGLLVFQGGIVQTNSSGVGNISLISSSYTIIPRNTPSWYGTVIVNQNTVETAHFVTSSGNIQITAKASSSIQIAPFTLMVNLS